ncbi:BIRA-like protein, partial [Mya arenaria]
MSLFNVEAVRSRLTSGQIGRDVIYKQVTTTTMDDAEKGARKGKGHGVAYVADTMTNARGSKGRSWHAESGGNIYVSFIIHRDAQQGVNIPERHLENDIEIAASLAALHVLQERGVSNVKVKWLNDLWVRGHKLLGALAEFKGNLEVEGVRKHLYILGLGLNLNSNMRHQSGLQGLATSVWCETGHRMLREDVFIEVCRQLEVNLAKPREELLTLYQQNSVLCEGTEVKVYFTDQSKPTQVCTYLGVDKNWAVRLKNGLPEDCALLVIGQLQAPIDYSLFERVRGHVEEGISCWLIGSACSLCTQPGSDDFLDDKQHSVIIRSSVEKIDFDCTKNIDLPLRDDEDQSKGDTFVAMATFNIGRGIVCLCVPHIEVAYPDVGQHFPSLEGAHTLIEDTVYQRDSLIIHALEHLGI